MFMPIQVTPIEMRDGEVIECSPIVIDFGDLTFSERIKINGKTYTKISLLHMFNEDMGYCELDEEPEYIVRESPKSFDAMCLCTYGYLSIFVSIKIHFILLWVGKKKPSNI